jgi:branched-subunit amino acid ABC-type transport system permease component
MNQVTLAIGFGLVTSSILALGAVGFSLQFGATNIFNLAFGDVMTASAFVAYAINVKLGESIWLALAGGALAGGVLSVLINRLIYLPFLRRGTALFTMVMVSLAVATIVQNVIQMIVGSNFYGYETVHERSLHIAGMLLTPRQLAIIAIAAASLVGLHVLLRHTRLGKAMRAAAADESLARGCGIECDRITSLAWLVSGTLCGLAGVALAMNLTTFDATTGNSFLLIIVAAAVFGTVGRPYGAMVGALVIGLASELAAIVSPSLKDVVAFGVLVLVLLVRPNGFRARFAVRPPAGVAAQ